MKTEKTRLAVMIPAYNEEETIGQVIKAIPKKMSGIGKTEVIVIDDGSKDRTAEVAERLGAFVVRNGHNKGLGFSFREGLGNALQKGADVIVNIDADMQFNPRDIPKLIEPIMNGEADMVTASRFIDRTPPKNMPLVKRLGNKAFTFLVNSLTGKDFKDTQCGFRAYSRDIALKLNLFGDFTYTQEVFLDLINKNARIKEVAIEVTYTKDRKSKIVSSLSGYAINVLTIMMRTFRDYHPLKFFAIPGLLVFFAGLFIDSFVFVRWVILHQTSPFRSFALVGIALIIIGILVMVLALIADMLKRMRKNQEEMLYMLRKKEFAPMNEK